jgi:hypothetical protein
MQSLKRKLPRLETEEGTVKVSKCEQEENAKVSIVQIVAGDSKVTLSKSEQFSKQRSAMTRTDFGICT